MNDSHNGRKPLPATQDRVIDVGAVVEMDAEVMKHGVLFIHPQLRPFKLKFQLADGKILTQFSELETVHVPAKRVILPEGNG